MSEISLIALLVGIGVTVLLGLGVGYVLSHNTDSLKPEWPNNISESDWGLVIGESGGSNIGFFERTLFLVALLIGEYSIIGFWLAFKLGAKWETWNHVVRLSEPELALGIRRKLGSWLLTRFLIGTLVNIIIAFIGAYLGVQLDAHLQGRT